jgi:hypothetical protein
LGLPLEYDAAKAIKPDNEIPSRRISEHIICSEMEVDMTNDNKKQKGAFGRVIDAIAAWEKAMDYTPYDYVQDRVSNLEREVLQLRDELRALPAGDSAGGRANPTSSSSGVAR